MNVKDPMVSFAKIRGIVGNRQQVVRLSQKFLSMRLHSLLSQQSVLAALAAASHSERDDNMVRILRVNGLLQIMI